MDLPVSDSLLKDALLYNSLHRLIINRYYTHESESFQSLQILLLGFSSTDAGQRRHRGAEHPRRDALPRHRLAAEIHSGDFMMIRRNHTHKITISRAQYVNEQYVTQISY